MGSLYLYFLAIPLKYYYRSVMEDQNSSESYEQ